MCVSYLQVSVDDAHLVQVVHSIQDLSDQRARVFLCVETFFHDSVEQLATGNPEECQDNYVCMSVCVAGSRFLIIYELCISSEPCAARTHARTHTQSPQTPCSV